MTNTIQSALHSAKKRIQSASDSAALDAQVLLGEVLGIERAYLLAHPEQALSPEQEARFAALVERCAAGEPLAYILGRRAFYDRDFMVSPAVLVPRPETEQLLELALDFARGKLSAGHSKTKSDRTSHDSSLHHAESTVQAVDVGTGSGALAVTLAAYCPQAIVYATDISPDALDIARHNAHLHQAQVRFFQGDLLAPLIEQNLRVDLIMANLPYIASDEVPTLAVSHYEPLLALDGGADGLNLVRRLLEQAPKIWNPGGLMLLEIGASQGAAASALAQTAFPQAQAQVLKDYAGLDRIVRVSRK